MRPIDYFDTAAELNWDRVAVVDGHTRLSFRELRGISERIARIFQSTTPRHRRVAIVAPNTYHCIAATLGAMRAGAALVPIHARDSIEQKLAVLELVEPQWVLYHSRLGDDAGRLEQAWTRSARWICLDRHDGAHESLDEAVEHAPEAFDTWSDAYGNPGQAVYIRQTSGTTGVPKAVVNDTGSFAATLAGLRHKLDSGPGMVFLVVAPLSHAAGLYAFAALTMGGTLVLAGEFEPDDVLQSISRHGVTHTWMPSNGLNLLLAHPRANAFDYSTLRQLVLGAAAASPEMLRDAVRVFGPCVCLNYSQIESGFLTWLDAEDVAAAVAGAHPQRLRSSGRSMFVSRVAIMDEHGTLLAPNETGEIVVRGRSVKPYLDESATREAQRDGWHHTGDLGYIDEDGYLFVVGRTKDNVITGGYKVSCAEVEDVLLELPQVAACAVIGVPHPLRGEAVTGVVVVRGGDVIAKSSIMRHCRNRLGQIRAPSRIEFWPELPRTPVGKIDKRAIREAFAEAGPRLRRPL